MLQMPVLGLQGVLWGAGPPAVGGCLEEVAPPTVVLPQPWEASVGPAGLCTP